LILDSHLDLAWNALTWKRDLTLDLAEINDREAGVVDDPARGGATVSLPQMRHGGVAVCLATVMARVPYAGHASVHTSTLDYPSHDIAHAVAQGHLSYYQCLEERNEIALIQTPSQLRQHWNRWRAANDDLRGSLPIGVIVAMEGCDAIVEPVHTERWFKAGLRCASLVHYGRSAYAVGTGDDGPLTPAGRELLKAFDRCGIILDVTHLCDTSFFEAIEIFHGPIHASHQNCRAVVPGDRQFTDEQIKLVIQRGGVLGVACDAWMLYPHWKRSCRAEEMTPRHVVTMQALVDHIDHICQLAGDSRHVAIGSDLDGGFGREQTPAGLDTIADLQKLASILSDRGYKDDAIDAVFHGNWLRFFTEHLPP